MSRDAGRDRAGALHATPTNDAATVAPDDEMVDRTIVGRPMARRKQTVSVPIGVEKLLCRAAADPALRSALLADREDGLRRAGVSLSAGERALVCAVPDPTLGAMIAHIDLKQHGKRRFLKGVATAAFASAALLSAATACTGIDPDMPPPADSASELSTDVPDIMTSRGAVPDEVAPDPQPDVPSDAPASLGISPDVPEM